MSKSKSYQQHYRTVWESIPEFQAGDSVITIETHENTHKFNLTYTELSSSELLLSFPPWAEGWLQPVPGRPSKAFCFICNKVLSAHRLALLRHTSTSKHTKLSQRKFILNGMKSNVVQSKTNTTEILTPATDLTDADINSSEDEAPNQYINEVSRPKQNTSDNVNTVQLVDDSPTISTHVLDTSKGIPVQNLLVSLYKLEDGKWINLKDCVTNPFGRCSEFIAREHFKPGRYKLHYDVNKYYEIRKQNSIYPFIEIVFDAHSPTQHYHIPLILSPYGYSTYKGS